MPMSDGYNYPDVKIFLSRSGPESPSEPGFVSVVYHCYTAERSSVVVGLGSTGQVIPPPAERATAAV